MIGPELSESRATVARLSGVRKAFRGSPALRDVDAEFAQGEIHALVGANGSGKSTLIKILAGVYAADAGQLEIGGATHDLRHYSPSRARAAGLHFVHQETSTFPDLSVAENLAIGRGFETGRLGRIRGLAVRRHTESVLARFGLDVDPDVRFDRLRPAEQAMVTIARALQDQDEESESILVLDEPTAALPAPEVEVLLSALRRYARAGRAIVLVSHRLDEVLGVADRVTVLRDGRRVATVRRADLDHDTLVELLVGRAVDAPPSPTSGQVAGEPLLETRNLCGGTVADVSLTLRRGELVGLLGIVGSGCSTLLRLLFGAQQSSGGTVTLDGERLSLRSPRDGMRAGIALVPANRASQALFADHSVEENMTVASISRYWNGVAVSRAREHAAVAADMDRFSVVAASMGMPISQLSGGNQQKVILSRWLRRSPRLLLLDEPTQGVDVGARAEIWSQVRGAVDDGAAALVASSDVEELAQVCDRIVFVTRGRVGGEASDRPFTADRLTSVMHGLEQVK